VVTEIVEGYGDAGVGGELLSLSAIPDALQRVWNDGSGPGTQAPPAQVSVVVQTFPSVQGLELFTDPQPVCGSQASVVQGLPSEGHTWPTYWHEPSKMHTSAVQAFPSAQSALVTHGKVLVQLETIMWYVPVVFPGAPAKTRT
jgi:hypothetical protein